MSTTERSLVEQRAFHELLGTRPRGTNERPSLARDLISTARPRQWVKNGFVVVPALFGGAFSGGAVTHVAIAVIAFCLGSSGLYFINDIADRDTDRLHPTKRMRPIASGHLKVQTAAAVAAALLAGGLVLAFIAAWATAALLGVYIASTLLYSVWLKHVAILDVIVIASGFVIRVGAGAAAASVVASEWLLLCTLFLALFLGFGKRYHELKLLGAEAHNHRPVLGAYTESTLAQFLNASMLGTLFSYCLYTFFSPQGVTHRGLMFTIPLAVYGVFRYTLLMETQHAGGAPEELIIADRPLQVATVLWVAVAVFVLYGIHSA